MLQPPPLLSLILFLMCQLLDLPLVFFPPRIVRFLLVGAPPLLSFVRSVDSPERVLRSVATRATLQITARSMDVFHIITRREIVLLGVAPKKSSSFVTAAAVSRNVGLAHVLRASDEVSGAMLVRETGVVRYFVRQNGVREEGRSRTIGVKTGGGWYV